MRALLLALVITTSPAMGVTPIRSTPAIAEAVRTGEIIGGAMACGASEARVLAVAQKLIQRPNPRPERGRRPPGAVLPHEQAVTRAAERIKAGEGNCGEALTSVAALDAQKP
jgi:hypothetical protein